MRSPRVGVPTDKSNAQASGRVFRSEMERQILAIQEAFSESVNDNERRTQSLEDRLRDLEREAERRKRDTEDRLRSVEKQKQDLENQLVETAGQLRKLQKSLPVRVARVFKRLNPLRLARKRAR
jgi:septal ring factor EnvC (AmiA/AmiB activator)